MGARAPHWSGRSTLACSALVLGVVACALPAATLGDGVTTSDGAGGSGATGGSGGATGGSGGATGGSGGGTSSKPGCELDCGVSVGTAGCCDSQLVPGGSFQMGRSTSGNDAEQSADSDPYGYGPAEKPEHPIVLSPFRLDTFEVTVGRFRDFVTAGGGTQSSPPEPGAGADPSVPNSGWNIAWVGALVADKTLLTQALQCGEPGFHTWTDDPATNEQKPQNCVSWTEAFAFCAWDGGWLPTEAEWEFAAAGGSENRYFPWSSPAASTSVDASEASFFDGASCVGDGASGCAPTDVVRVGSKLGGAGAYGHYDLGGNVWEWVFDWYRFDWYTKSTCTADCANTDDPDVVAEPAPNQRVIRGGGYHDTAPTLRAAHRYSLLPSARQQNVGFRCARAP
ncbi:MAG: formylglycine-generating enzyme family protein [Polyangiaceae bacterium]|nr:formylglycine-generating enzyme family protein [Polyangiaceae bacterium]